MQSKETGDIILVTSKNGSANYIGTRVHSNRGNIGAYAEGWDAAVLEPLQPGIKITMENDNVD